MGKKVFFLYPQPVIQSQIITVLAQHEFEVYAVKDHIKLKEILKKYPDSVVFVDINDQFPDSDCEAWIKEVSGNPAMRNIALGVTSAAVDAALQKKYTETIKLKCGFLYLKANQIAAAIKHIIDALQSVDAKGRRKYLRVTLDHDTSVSINIPTDIGFAQGSIKDISVAGLSCAFKEDPKLQKNALFRDIQIKLQSMIIKAEGIIFGSRMDGSSKVYVLLFTPRVSPDVHTKIRLYIQQNLQAKMDVEMKR